MREMWLVKVRRYDGSVSVLGSWPDRENAELEADLRNVSEQSENYYVEKFDESKLRWPTKPVSLDLSTQDCGPSS